LTAHCEMERERKAPQTLEALGFFLEPMGGFEPSTRALRILGRVFIALTCSCSKPCAVWLCGFARTCVLFILAHSFSPAERTKERSAYPRAAIGRRSNYTKRQGQIYPCLIFSRARTISGCCSIASKMSRFLLFLVSNDAMCRASCRGPGIRSVKRAPSLSRFAIISPPSFD
jgi:hypothetical protein